MAGPDFRLQLQGYGLTTAEIHYRMPDHLSLLQLFVWQDYDLAPASPHYENFLTTGRKNWTGRSIPYELLTSV